MPNTWLGGRGGRAAGRISERRISARLAVPGFQARRGGLAEAAEVEREGSMAYVDGFIVPVRAEQREAYRKMAAEAAQVFKDHGALAVVEAWGDDVPEGKLTSFPMAVKLEEGECVVFSWIIWPSRAARDAGNEKAMQDPRMQPPADVPFSMERIIFGGFEELVAA
jgi:uncharacterized protein YbaA (DUF1428 family)